MFEQQLVESSASAILSSVPSAATIPTAVPRLSAGFAASEADVHAAESTVAAIYQQLSERYLAPAEYRAFARQPMALPRLVAGAAGAEARPARPSLPPLIKGYLRLGAWVCSDPALDQEFNSVDVLILLPVSRMSARYARHYAAA